MDRAPQNKLRLVPDATPSGKATPVADTPQPAADRAVVTDPKAGGGNLPGPAVSRRSPGAVLRGWLSFTLRLLRPVTTAIRDYWIVGFTLVAGLAVAVGLLWLIWMIVKVLVAAVSAASDGVGQLLHWVTYGPITRSISDPVTAYLTAHSQGLPASGHQLWMAWLVVAGVLYLGALLASPYARIGWAAAGVLTVLAAYAGAPAEAGPGAAAATAVVWLLLSAPAYARTPRLDAQDTHSTRDDEPAAKPAGQAADEAKED